MGISGVRAGALCVAMAAAIGVADAAPTTAAPTTNCTGWHSDTVASGLGQLENLEPDGRGGFYVSGYRKIYHVDSSGSVRTVLDDVAAPGGLQLDGTTLYLLTRSDGELWRYDTVTEQLSHMVDFPGNGLLRLPDGDFLTTWIGTEDGPSRGVSRYDHTTGEVVANWSPTPRAEGLSLSPDHRAVYTDDLFTGQIYRIPLDAPDRWTVVTRVPGLLPGPDDVTASAEGDLYVAGHISGTVHRVHLESGASCVIAADLAKGWAGPTSVRIGPDGDRSALYVTSFDGTLRRLRPPSDVRLTPIDAF